MKMEHENIMRVLDVNYIQFSQAFIGFIAKSQAVYKDRVLEEDLFSVGDLREDHEKIPEPIEKELAQIAELMHKNECAYFRIVYH